MYLIFPKFQPLLVRAWRAIIARAGDFSPEASSNTGLSKQKLALRKGSPKFGCQTNRRYVVFRIGLTGKCWMSSASTAKGVYGWSRSLLWRIERTPVAGSQIVADMNGEIAQKSSSLCPSWQDLFNLKKKPVKGEEGVINT